MTQGAAQSWAPPAPPELLTPAAVAAAYQTDARGGLTPEEAERRLALAGPNELLRPVPPSFVARLARQLTEPMTVLLLAAALLAGAVMGDVVDACAIVAIVVLNAAIALIQEGRASAALEALRDLETPVARVVRDGTAVLVPSAALVPGDVVLLAAGDRVPADIRLCRAASLEIDESLLTGESLPVVKDPAPIPGPQAVLAEQSCMAFSGTIVTAGSATGIVVATGPLTQLGSIAAKLAGPRLPTRLQGELRQLTGRMAMVAAGAGAVVLGLSLARGGAGSGNEALQRAFLPAVALAVAAVPEGMATVVTVALARGVHRMAGRGAIVRRLAAVETLGSTTVVLTDKTGTLTENRLRVEAILGATGSDAPAGRALGEALRVAVLCNDASLDPPAGDPLEIALLEAAGAPVVAAFRAGEPRIAEAPFDSGRKRMSTLHRDPTGGFWLMVKGTPESVARRSGSALDGEGAQQPLDDGDRGRLQAVTTELAGRGMRVLALARRWLPGRPADLAAEEHDLTLVGLAALGDQVRAEAGDAVAAARRAGIQVAMVTGDHPGTAAAVAAAVGIAVQGCTPVTGRELRAGQMPADLLAIPVYARVDPEHKLSLVESLQAQGHVVAVTGDGVNDAPALRRADVGVAMGRSGTAAAREAADVVVTDDNLATIVAAVGEGRAIYDNIRKVVDYLVGANLSEIAVVLGCLVAFPSLDVPLLPLQLLWINLVTDGLPAIALGMDPADPDLMHRAPRPAGERLLSGHRLVRLAGRGLALAGAALLSLAVARVAWGQSWHHARSIMFCEMALAQLFYAAAIRRPSPDAGAAPHRGSWPLGNGLLVLGVVSGLLLQVLLVAVPPVRSLFGLTWLAARDWGLVLAGALLPAAMVAFRPRNPPASQPA